MNLNLPIYEQLSKCKNVLIAGMGGGFDIFCGLPIYFELKRLGLQVHLANFSFSDVETAQGGVRLSKTLVGATGELPQRHSYFPEHFLARWFDEENQEKVIIWTFQKSGVIPLLENYKILVEHLAIDGILLIDGGVDSLVRGDEDQKGTLLEDAVSAYAVSQLSAVPVKLIGCIGLGAELDMTYAHIMENVADLTRQGGFLGACALTPEMTVYKLYEEAVFYVQSQPYHDESVINSSIISAVRGNFGDYHLTRKTLGSRLWISPLMTLYWFFDFELVVKHNQILPYLADTQTFMDAVRVARTVIPKIISRPAARIPL
jgi:hypothetical protein